MNQFFWPDVAATGQFVEDAARHMSERGSDVTVICSTSLYAGASESGHPPPVKIVRVRGGAFSYSVAGRAFSYASFFLGALWAALRSKRHDVVVTLTTPPMLPIAGTIVKTLRGGRHYIWEMDLFPEALVSLGVITRNSVIAALLGKIADYSRRKCDGIIVPGECMRERLLSRGVPGGRIHVAENWADGNLIRPTPLPDKDPLTILYSGTLALSHDVETILSAMEILKDDPRFRFVFIGGGTAKSILEERCRAAGLTRVVFQPYRKRRDVGAALASGHIGLVTMKSPCAGTVVPSKVYGIMAAQRPILFIGPRDSTPADLIEKYQCGWQIDCGDVKGLIGLLNQLFISRGVVREAAARAREAFTRDYGVRQGVGRISRIIDAMASEESQNETDCGGRCAGRAAKAFRG